MYYDSAYRYSAPTYGAAPTYAAPAYASPTTYASSASYSTPTYPQVTYDTYDSYAYAPEPISYYPGPSYAETRAPRRPPVNYSAYDDVDERPALRGNDRRPLGTRSVYGGRMVEHEREERVHNVDILGKRRKRHSKPFSETTMTKLAGPGLLPNQKVAGALPYDFVEKAYDRRGEFDDTASTKSGMSSASQWSSYSSASGKVKKEKRRSHSMSVTKPFQKKYQENRMNRGNMNPIYVDDEQTVMTTRSIPQELDRDGIIGINTPLREDPPINIFGNVALPPDPPSQLNLMEIVLLLHCKDGKLTNRHTRGPDVEFAIGAAMLLDLYLMGKIEPHPNTVRDPTKFLIRVVNREPTGEEHLDRALERIGAYQGREPKDLQYWLWAVMKSLGGKRLTPTIAQSLAQRGLVVPISNDQYEIGNEVAYADAYNHIDVLMAHRDGGGEAPLRCSIVGALYWMPKDWIQYCFGQGPACYEAKQMCKAVLYAIKQMWKSMS